MTSIQPQTIVIRTLQAKSPTTVMVSSQLEHDMLEDLYGDGGGPRKRRRLTHLSQDEKLLRRKLKNRVAAQTARDRKKCLMSELEQKVAELEQENRKLAQENQALKAESGTLQKQNSSLKERLSLLGCAPIKTELGTGSAASAGLQQQGQIPPVSFLTNTYAASMLTLSGFGKRFLLQAIMNTDGEEVEELITGAHEISMASAVMSGLEDVNSSPLYVALTRRRYHENLCVQPDNLVSLLQPLSQQSADNTRLCTVQLESLQGTTVLTTELAVHETMVGPTPTELESLQELIKFDHVYFKSQSQRTADSALGVGQTKQKNYCLKDGNYQLVTDDGTKTIKNLKIIITSDKENDTDIVPKIPQKIEKDICENQFLSDLKTTDLETVNLTDNEFEELSDINMDLLNDLENILKADAEGLSCFTGNDLQSQSNIEELDVRTHSNIVKIVAPIEKMETTCDTRIIRSPTKSVSGDSDYVSDIQSPYNDYLNSPSSTKDTDSSIIIEDLDSHLDENTWEESFTELFPDLM